MKCTKCGYENKEGSKFCLKCGNKLSEEVKVEKSLEESKAPDEEVCSESPDKTEVISEKNKQTASVIIETPSKSKNKNLVIALSAVAVVIISAAVIGISSINSDEELSAPEIKSASVTETVETAEQTAVTEAVASETTAHTTVTTKQTTRETTTEAATTTQAETMSVRSNAKSFSLSCGTIEFVDNNYYTAWRNFVGDIDCFNFYQLTPYVNFYNSEVSLKIQNALNDILTIYSGESSGVAILSSPYEIQNYDTELYRERKIESVYEENGLIFISVSDLNVDGWVYPLEDISTYVFDSATGEQYTIYDFIIDKDNLVHAVDEYIESDVDFEIDKYEDFYDTIEGNLWNYGDYGEWSYDGKNLTVFYNLFRMYDEYPEKIGFNIPKNVWSDYLDFSVKKKSNSVTVTNIDDSYKEDNSFTTEPGYIDGPPSNYDELGLYWIFYEGNDLHNLRYIAELAVENACEDGRNWTADDFYYFLNENWTYYCGCWYFTSGNSSISDSEMVIGEPGATKYIEYARIPYSEYEPYLTSWYFQ